MNITKHRGNHAQWLLDTLKLIKPDEKGDISHADFSILDRFVIVRISEGLSVAKFGKILKLSEIDLRNHEQNQTDPKTEILVAFAKEYPQYIAYLMTGKTTLPKQDDVDPRFLEAYENK